MIRSLRIYKAAWLSIKSHPLRSVLTSVGIIAGVAAIVMVASIAEGTRKSVALSIEELGANRLDVNSGSRVGKLNALMPFGGLYQLSDKDVEITRGTAGVAFASGFLRGSAEVSRGQDKATVAWIGSDNNALQVLGYSLQSGRAFTTAEGSGVRRVVHLGAATARQLFKGKPAVGSRIRISGASFTVIGVLAPRGLSVSGQDLDDVLIIPVNSARRQLMGDFPLPNRAIQQIGVRVSSVADLGVVQGRIERNLGESRNRKGLRRDDFYIISVLGTVQSSSHADRSMAYLLLSVAAICLVVGGVGVMNIMLVSIAERTGEIGLRMAVGASPRDILHQFLFEASLLSFSGGALGILFGIAGSVLAAHYQGIASEVSMSVVLVGFLVTVGTGIGFGIVPAYRAAKLPPSYALRRL